MATFNIRLISIAVNHKSVLRCKFALLPKVNGDEGIVWQEDISLIINCLFSMT